MQVLWWVDGADGYVLLELRSQKTKLKIVKMRTLFLIVINAKFNFNVHTMFIRTRITLI